MKRILKNIFCPEKVILIDFDGEVSIRRVWISKIGVRIAKRMLNDVVLKKDGTIIGPCYVKKWIPYSDNNLKSLSDVIF